MGYKPIMDATAKEEKPTLNAWIRAHEDDPCTVLDINKWETSMILVHKQRIWGMMLSRPVLYGIENLKRIIPNLAQWTTEEGKNYDDLGTLYGQVCCPV